MDKVYSHILFATDLGPQSLYIGHEALKIAELSGAELFMLHVVEPPILYTSDFSKTDLSIKKSQEIARKSLTALGIQLGISTSNSMIVQGNPQIEILKTAEAKNVNLIVVGSHGIGGYTHGLGSTAHNLLSQSHCNVLIVQVSHLQGAIEAHTPAGEYMWQTPLHPPTRTSFLETKAKHYGSNKGFGEVIRRGPRPGNRPPHTPYRGGTRPDESDEDEKDK